MSETEFIDIATEFIDIAFLRSGYAVGTVDEGGTFHQRSTPGSLRIAHGFAQHLAEKLELPLRITNDQVREDVSRMEDSEK